MGQTKQCVVTDDTLAMNNHYLIHSPEELVKLIPRPYNAKINDNRIALWNYKDYFGFDFDKITRVKRTEKYLVIDFPKASVTLYFVDNSKSISLF